MRETKTAAEIEALIFEKLRAMPNGDDVEGVSVYAERGEGLEPMIGVGYGGDTNIGPILREAARLFAECRRDYDIQAR